MAKKLLSQEEFDKLAEEGRQATEKAKKLPKDSSLFDWIKNLPPLPEIGRGKKVAVHIPKKRK